MRTKEAIDRFIMDVGNVLIFTTLAWFFADPNYSIWFLCLGWCIGATFTLWRRTR